MRSRLYLKTRPDEDDDNLRILATMKSNYGAKGKDLRLRWLDGVFVNVGLLEDHPTVGAGDDA